MCFCCGVGDGEEGAAEVEEQDCGMEPLPLVRAVEAVRVGTCCSGLGALPCALRLEGIPFQYLFASVTEECARVFLQANTLPDRLYSSSEGSLGGPVEQMHIYVASLPLPVCQ